MEFRPVSQDFMQMLVKQKDSLAIYDRPNEYYYDMLGFDMILFRESDSSDAATMVITSSLLLLGV
jgi:hypothetical protein